MHQPTSKDVAVKAVHIIPVDHQNIDVDGEDIHTTAACWCDPVKVELVRPPFLRERVYFHRLLSECEGNT
jgi:hypothetical protein